MDNEERKKFSDLICYLQDRHYVTVNPKMIGKYDVLIDTFEIIQERKADNE